MQEQDEINLKRMCNVTEVPENVLKFYRQFQRVQHRYKSGPLPVSTLQTIAVLAGFGGEGEAELLQKLEYDWDKVPRGADVRIYMGKSLSGGRGNIYSGTFMDVLRGDDFGYLEIAIDGESVPVSKVDHRIVRFTPGVGSPVMDQPQEAAISDVEPVFVDAVQTGEDTSVNFTEIEIEEEEGDEPEVLSVVSGWADVKVGTPVVVAESEGGAILHGTLYRVPSQNGKHAGKLYVDVMGDKKKYRQYNEEEVTIAVTQRSNA